MDKHDFGAVVLGVVVGVLIVVIGFAFALEWATESLKTASLDITPPLFFVPK